MMNTIYKTFSRIIFTATVITGLSVSTNAQVTNLILNGNMEGTAAAWTQTSTNFGTPLCTAACGLGGGTGPHAGSGWCWFGGLGGAVEQASLVQTVTIPTGLVSANLNFWLEVPVCDSVGGLQDYMALLIDADTLYFVTGNDILCGTIGYGQQTFNVLAYADGNPHTITFTSTTFGTGGPTNFFVDDVELLADNGSVAVDCADTSAFSPALAITDGDSTGVADAQTLSGLTGTLGSTTNLVGVLLNVSHTWVGDVRLRLTAPNGTQITLMDRPGVPASTFGCDGDDLDFEIIRGTGNDVENVCSNAPAISGSYTAANGQDLNAINIAGGSPNGTWTLDAADFATPDPGTINSWSLIFSSGPVASFNAPSSICATSGNVSLTPLVTGTAGGTWSGAGVTGTTLDPTGLTTTSITYTVTDGSGCTDSQTSTILIAPGAPSASFSFSATANTVTFTNTSTNGGTYAWDFGDSGTSTDTNAVHTYASTGSYTVTLTATNACGTNSTTQTVTLGCADFILDGGLEAGAGGGSWTEFSTNFTTPLCNAACGLGGGTGPNTGSWWSWFGGLGGAIEQGSLAQSVTIPANATSADLSFFTEYPVCDSVGGAQDVFFVIFGSDTIYQTTGADVDCGVVGYQQRTYNVLSAATGTPTNLEFNSTTFGTGGPTNFFVDDIALVVCTPVGIQELVSGASISVVPNPASSYVDISFKNYTDNINISISDMTGKVVYNSIMSGKTTQNRIDVSKWSKGVYLISFTAFDKNYSQKLVIK